MALHQVAWLTWMQSNHDQSSLQLAQTAALILLPHLCAMDSAIRAEFFPWSLSHEEDDCRAVITRLYCKDYKALRELQNSPTTPHENMTFHNAFLGQECTMIAS